MAFPATEFPGFRSRIQPLLTEPAEDLMRLSQFLNRPVDLAQMQAVIDISLYRQRS